MVSVEKAFMDTYRVVGVGSSPPLTIGPDGDGLGCVRIYASTAEAKEYWGPIELILPPEIAHKLCSALVATVAEIERAAVGHD